MIAVVDGDGNEGQKEKKERREEEGKENESKERVGEGTYKNVLKVEKRQCSICDLIHPRSTSHRFSHLVMPTFAPPHSRARHAPPIPILYISPNRNLFP